MIAPRRALALFAGGGVGLALCDQIHVQADVLRYDVGGLFGQAWWVPLQFGVASLAIVAGAAPFVRYRPAPRERDFVTGVAWFVAAYAASGVFDAQPEALAAGLALAWLARVAVAEGPRERRREGPREGRRDGVSPRAALVAYSLLLAAAGTGAEAILSAAGTFEYLHPDFVGVPVWLPLLYLHGAPLALALARAPLPR